jgi:hypothetical protein
MIFKDILMELKAIRLGLQLQLRLQTGSEFDLLSMAELEQNGSAVIPIKPRRPREQSAIIHRNDDKRRAKETLEEMGDDTPLMIEYIRSQFGDEAAAGAQAFYEEEILKG